LTRIAPGLTRARECVVDQLPGLLVQGKVQGDDVAARREVAEAGAVLHTGQVGGRLANRIVGQDPHPEGRGQRRGPAADPAKADHAQRGAVEVPDADPGALGPAPVADHRGERAEPLDQVQGHADRALGDRGGAGPRGDHHGDPPGRRGGYVDQVGADPGPGDDAERGRPAQQRPVDPGVGPGDRALRDGEFGVAGRGSEPAVPVEHAGH
jgi:hypothetical protein